eukprot:4800892-Prymnesium_polylepis.1
MGCGGWPGGAALGEGCGAARDQRMRCVRACDRLAWQGAHQRCVRRGHGARARLRKPLRGQGRRRMCRGRGVCAHLRKIRSSAAHCIRPSSCARVVTWGHMDMGSHGVWHGVTWGHMGFGIGSYG